MMLPRSVDNSGRTDVWLREALGLKEPDTPFPWQVELLRRLRLGDIPRALDIPTGLGKTAVMAIWLVARACGANLPRRLVYVVDRRAIIDQATEVAIGLRDFVDRSPALKSGLGLGKGRSLPISTLRGQYADKRDWLEDPGSPAIIVGTVDLIGSRLLFEGYGVSRKMRPYHAGFIGVDALLALDEAHLVPPFEALLKTIVDDVSGFGPRAEEPQRIVPPLKLLSLSATGRSAGQQVFGLTPEDRASSVVVQKRLDAKKYLRILPLDEDAKLEDELAKRAWDLSATMGHAVRCIVFCDKREVARKAKDALEKLAKGDEGVGKPAVQIDTDLFVGGRRVFEREGVKKRLEQLGFLAGSQVARTRPAFLFATSAAEVGVDLDADHMVCDLVAWERMVQRLGRVNRRGGGEARVVVLAEPEPENIENLLQKPPSERKKKDAGLVEHVMRARAVKELLGRLPQSDNGFDASPGALRELKQSAEKDQELQKCLNAATTPAPMRPALSRAVVDAWAMTSLEKHAGRPAISPWLRGWIEDDLPQTAVLWRRHLPVRNGAMSATKSEVEAFFEAAPPHLSELLETETYRVVKWLEARARRASEKQASTAPHSFGEQGVVGFVLTPKLNLSRTLRLADFAGDQDNEATENKRNKKLRDVLDEALAGATLVVDARLAGLRDGLLDEAEGASPRTADDGKEWLGENTAGFRVRILEPEQVIAQDGWCERLRFPVELSEDGQPARLLIVEKLRHDAANEEDRSAGLAQRLDEHESWAEERAREIAVRLSLPEPYAEMLAAAARFHDEGKRAARWQRAFHAPDDGEPYAKTRGPIDYALLDGYRHELASLLEAEKNRRIVDLSKDLRDLALHLVAAHHGFARPYIETRSCDSAPPSLLEERAKAIALRFSKLQRLWGPWGLAWWEALLRAADQQASRDNDGRDNGAGKARRRRDH